MKIDERVKALNEGKELIVEGYIYRISHDRIVAMLAEPPFESGYPVRLGSALTKILNPELDCEIFEN